MATPVSKKPTPKPTPEQLLERLESEEEYQSRGRLKVFLGYASGVGKSFRMLDEGRRRHERGQDVVVGATQARLSQDVLQAISTLETIPSPERNGVPVMDVAAILRRKPKVCLVDGLAYDNPPGAAHAKRWQDVETLLDAGISVITSVNLQHIDEKRAQVESITGKHVSQTVPLTFLNTADEIVVVDAPPDTCMRVEADQQPSQLRRLTQQQLSELREIALLLAADVVDEQLERYLARHGIEQLWGTQERILVVLSPRANASANDRQRRAKSRPFSRRTAGGVCKPSGLAPGTTSEGAGRLAFGRTVPRRSCRTRWRRCGRHDSALCAGARHYSNLCRP